MMPVGNWLDAKAMPPGSWVSPLDRLAQSPAPLTIFLDLKEIGSLSEVSRLLGQSPPRWERALDYSCSPMSSYSGPLICSSGPLTCPLGHLACPQSPSLQTP